MFALVQLKNEWADNAQRLFLHFSSKPQKSYPVNNRTNVIFKKLFQFNQEFIQKSNSNHFIPKSL